MACESFGSDEFDLWPLIQGQVGVITWKTPHISLLGGLLMGLPKPVIFFMVVFE